MSKRIVEVFTSGCPVCEPAVELVKRLACDSCEVIIYDLNKGCGTNECREKAKSYGVNRLPAVAINGTLVECCKVGGIDEDVLKKAGLGVS